MLTVQELNSEFGNSEIRFYSDPAGLIRAELNNLKGKAEIALHGAHLLSYIPKEQEPVLWMSEKSWFLKDKPIRGGIPVCWPWFGGHPDNPDMPSHGFARISEWEVFESGNCDNGATYLELALTPGLIAEKFKNGDFLVKFRVEVSNELSASLIIENTGKDDLAFSAALHSYFKVSDISKVSLVGLDGRPFIDTLDDSRHVQQGNISFDAEIDRIYLDTEDSCVIDDPGLKRRIRISKNGSSSTVVWNPWIAKAKRMPDFGDEEYKEMLCVETTNADRDARILSPGESHTLQVVIEAAAY